MAKPPKVGSKVTVAEYIVKNVLRGDKNYKVIQPQVISHFDETFWWVAKIIVVDEDFSAVGIQKRREAGLVVVTEKNDKLKTVYSAMHKGSSFE